MSPDHHGFHDTHATAKHKNLRHVPTTFQPHANRIVVNTIYQALSRIKDMICSVALSWRVELNSQILCILLSESRPLQIAMSSDICSGPVGTGIMRYGLTSVHQTVHYCTVELFVPRKTSCQEITQVLTFRLDVLDEFRSFSNPTARLYSSLAGFSRRRPEVLRLDSSQVSVDQMLSSLRP